MEKNSLQWFKDRIGKVVYRNAETSCKCKVCKRVYEKGLSISDDLHANYLFYCQNEMNLIYSDKPNFEIENEKH